MIWDQLIVDIVDICLYVIAKPLFAVDVGKERGAYCSTFELYHSKPLIYL